MKCPKCGHQQKHKDGMTCLNCKRKFIVDPKSNGFSDNYLYSLVKKISQEGKLFYTLNQLYAFNAYRKTKPWKVIFILLLIGGSVVLNIFVHHPVVLVICVIIILVSIFSKKSKKKISKTALKQVISSWPSNDKLWQNLITPNKPLFKDDYEVPEEFFDYGMEGIIIVNQPTYVDLLIQNEWHLELKCAVVSMDGYPKSIYQKCQNLLEDPEMKVYLLHDGTINEEDMLSAFSQGHDIQAEIIDLGLSPSDFKKGALKQFNTYEFKNKPLDLIPPSRLHSLIVGSVREGVSIATLIHDNESTDKYIDFG